MIFSIITVCFNNRDGLEKTIKSVICQTYKDYEFIVIDGGSKDGTKELLEQYDDKIDFWCSEPDNGVYNAMNKGILHSKGEYLIFMNSGDCFYSNSVLEDVKNLRLDVDIISGQVERMDNSKLIRQYDGQDLLMQLYLDTINHQGTFIKKTLFDNNLYDESLKVVSDWKFWVENIICKGCNTVVIDNIIAKQDMTGLSTSSQSNFWLEERKKILNELFPKLIQKELDDRNRNKGFWNRIHYLEENSRFGYIFARKLLAAIVKLVGCLKKF